MKWIKHIGDLVVFRNWISVFGLILTVFSFFFILGLFIVDYLSQGANPYLTTFAYIISPVFLIFGLILIPIGAVFEKRRFHKTHHLQRFPVIDFNLAKYQAAAYVFIAVTTVLLIFSSIGAYKAYEFTESPQFCGVLCHEPMQPEYLTYQRSPHAKVSCVACHVGHGAEHYVAAKARGVRQLLGVVTGDYERPIQPPLNHMLSAQETCEKCHWSKNQFSAIGKEYRYFLPDENNTEWITNMMIYVGTGSDKYAAHEGVHWHMKEGNEIYYVAEDEKRQTIPWVKKIGPDGKEIIYVSEDSGYSQDNPPRGEVLVMDCLSCHNRPSHRYQTPVDAVNEGLADEKLDKTLPYFKREAVNALTGDYETREEGESSIRESLESFYKKEYPETWEENKDAIETSVLNLLIIYRRNFFPHMKASWTDYPDNSGHFNFQGCFRCHDGLHRNQEDQVISNDCNSCHSVIAQGPKGALETNALGLPFKHPEDIEGLWQEMSCTDCHDGSLT